MSPKGKTKGERQINIRMPSTPLLGRLSTEMRRVIVTATILGRWALSYSCSLLRDVAAADGDIAWDYCHSLLQRKLESWNNKSCIIQTLAPKSIYHILTIKNGIKDGMSWDVRIQMSTFRCSQENVNNKECQVINIQNDVQTHSKTTTKDDNMIQRAKFQIIKTHGEVINAPRSVT